jgi:hypothetical protein
MNEERSGRVYLLNGPKDMTFEVQGIVLKIRGCWHSPRSSPIYALSVASDRATIQNLAYKLHIDGCGVTDILRLPAALRPFVNDKLQPRFVKTDEPWNSAYKYGTSRRRRKE